MKINYSVMESTGNKEIIKADYGNGVWLFIPADPANSDYQRYLRWLENPDAEEDGTLS